MKAIVQNAHGSPEVLELKEIDKPVIKKDDFLRSQSLRLCENSGEVFA